MDRDKGINDSYINDFSDILAYLGLRTPATYAQIYSALSQVQEIIPSWEPKSLLDIGTGPGTGIWATKAIWPNLETVACIDQEKFFLSTAKEIIQESSIAVSVSFGQENITQIKNNGTMYNLVLVANVLNELSIPQQKDLLKQAYSYCNGIMVIIEPGTPFGIKIVQDAVKSFPAKATLLAPYINNTFVESNERWVHFSQRFIRPDFQRRIRQYMRESPLMASDWEETKYTYAAIGKVSIEEKIWGRVVGSIKKQKGFIGVDVITQDGVTQIKVLKRHKKEYAFAKNLQWGQIIKDKEDIINKT